MASKTVVILGGGIGDIVAANDLRRKLSAEHRVVLPPDVLWLAFPFSRSCCITEWNSFMADF